MDVLFVTHADVVIDPAIEVTKWPLSDRGRARHAAHAQTLTGIDTIWSSTERKALDAAGIYASALSLQPQMLSHLGENDRSATGYLPPEQFEAMADRFFANPDIEVSGWESAADAQRRIIAAMDRIAQSGANKRVLVTAHGAVGALLLAHLSGTAISRAFDQPPGSGGGNVLSFHWPAIDAGSPPRWQTLPAP